MISVVLLIIALLFPHAINLHTPQRPGNLSGSDVSFSNHHNDSVDLIISTQIWQDKQSAEFFLLVDSDAVIKSIQLKQGSDIYELNSDITFLPQTASIVIHIPEHASFGVTRANVPLKRQVRLRHFLMSKLRLKGYKTCTFQDQQTSNGITIKLNCSARAGWAEVKST